MNMGRKVPELFEVRFKTVTTDFTDYTDWEMGWRLGA